MKERLDLLLVKRGLAPSRERAKAYIMEGVVFVNGAREDKPGSTFDEEQVRDLVVKFDPIPYVSRGGLKLAHAIGTFALDVRGLLCLDIGASTGGFTDCLLQNGAARVYSVDSGTNQLDYRLRTDPRVVCMERTNFRYLSRADFGEDLLFDFACADVSFISLTKILPAARALLRDGAQAVCLVKPQFEVGRELVGKNGIVRDERVRAEVCERVAAFAEENGFRRRGLVPSPILGTKGNQEFLLWLEKV